MRSIYTSLILVALLANACTGVLGVREMKYYNILGVAEDADEKIIKKAYKKQALYDLACRYPIPLPPVP